MLALKKEVLWLMLTAVLSKWICNVIVHVPICLKWGINDNDRFIRYNHLLKHTLFMTHSPLFILGPFAPLLCTIIVNIINVIQPVTG